MSTNPKSSKTALIIITIVISIGLFIFGSIFIGVGMLFDYFLTSEYDSQTEGIVTELVPGGDGFQAKYEFKAGDKTYESCTSATTSSKNMWVPGNSITIYYNSQNPQENDDAISLGVGQVGKWIFLIFGIFWALVSIIGGITAIVIINKKYSQTEQTNNYKTY